MSFDPNLYAIQLELGIDSSEAFSAVDKLHRSAIEIEQSLTNAMAAVMGQVVSHADQIDERINDIFKGVTDINNAHAQQSENFSEALQQQVEMGEHIKEQIEDRERMRDIIEEISDLEEMIGTLNEAIVLHMRQAGQHANTFNTRLGGSSSVIDDIHDGFGDVNNQIESMNDGLGRVDTNLAMVIRSIRTSTDDLIANAESIAGMVRASEDFVTSNYRAYGAQHQLMVNTTELSSEFGVLQETAHEAYRALMDIQTPLDVLIKFTESVSQVSRITGVGVRPLAEYAKALNGIGMSASEVTTSIESLSAAQETFGMTTQEVSNMVEAHIRAINRLSFAYGKQVPADLAVATGAMTQMAKQVGSNMTVVDEMNNLLAATGIEAITLRARLGAGFDSTIEGRFNAVSGAARGLAAQMLSLKAANDDVLTDEMIISFSAQAKAMGMSYDMVEMYAKVLEDAAANGKDLEIAFADFEKQMQSNLDRQRQFNESMNTLYAAVEKLKDSFWSLAAPFVAFIARGMMPFIKAATWVVDIFVSMITRFSEAWNTLESWIPAMWMLRRGLELLVGGGLLFGGVIVGMIGLIGTVVSMFGMLASAIGNITGLFGTFLTSMTSGMATIGRVFIAFMSSLGNGLNILGSSVRAVMIPLLALGLTITLVGTGAYMFAKATSIIAEQGWGAVGAMLALTTAVAALGAVMVALATITTSPIAIGLLAISAAFLSIGAAAWMMGAGVMMATTGITNMLNAIGDDTGARLAMLASGLYRLAIQSVIVTPGLLLLAVGLAAVAAPAMAAGVGMSMLLSAIGGLQNIELPEFGDKFEDFANEISAGAFILAAAILPLAVSGNGLSLFVGALESMGSIELPDLGGKLIVMADEIEYGASVLGGALVPLVASGVGLSAFVVGLRGLAGLDLSGVGENIKGAADEILESASVLGAASLTLIAVSPSIATAGVALQVAGLPMMAGAMSLNFASLYIESAVKRLDGSADILTQFANGANSIASVDLSNIRNSVIDVGVAANHIYSNIDKLEDAAIRMNNINFDASGIEDSIAKVAISLERSAGLLEDPINTLREQVEATIDQINKLVDAEARLHDMEIKVATKASDGHKQRPNEIRTVEKVTESVQTVVDKSSDKNSEEMVVLLRRLVELLEEKEKPEHWDRSNHNERPSRGRNHNKFAQAGVSM